MSYALTLGTVAFFLAVVWGRPLINWLRRHRIGKQIRIEGPSTHMVKAGTPTMGGLMIVGPVIAITVVLNVGNLLGLNLIGRSILVPMAAMVMFAILGAVDDYQGVRRKLGEPLQGYGLLGRYKFAWQLVFAFIIALVLYFGLDLRSVALPGVPEKVDIGILYIPIAAFIIVGTTNAVNLTDGLDALAGSIAALCFVAYGVIAFLQGQSWLVAFCFTVVGALLAFLWYNAHPAELFMGDVGALALGATLAVVALMTGQWLLLPVVGFVFMAETVSVILQVVYFKWTKGKRLFKMSPLHNHFELQGWSETQVQQRLWLVSILSAMLGIALALI